MAGYRIGHGYDLHRLEPRAPDGAGRPFILGGLLFDHALGPVGHSDGDAVLHAVTDALLGAIGEPDIGQLFPDTDSAHDGQDSSTFLAEAVARITRHGFRIGNIDITMTAEINLFESDCVPDADDQDIWIGFETQELSYNVELAADGTATFLLPSGTLLGSGEWNANHLTYLSEPNCKAF